MLSHFSPIWLFATLWSTAHQAPLSMGFSRQEDWSGLPCPSPVTFPTQELNSCLLHLLHWQGGSLPLVPPRKPKLQNSPVQFFLTQHFPILTWQWNSPVSVKQISHRISTGLRFSKCGPWDSSICTTWRLVRNVDYQARTQTYQIVRSCWNVLSSSSGYSDKKV